MSKVKLMTQTEYAQHRGCSAVAVHKAIKAGRISLADGKLIDPTVADIQWTANTRARITGKQLDLAQNPPAAAHPDATVPAAPPAAPGPDDGYLLSRSRREAAEANIAEMKEREMRGRYLDKAEVDSAIFGIARALRDGLTNCARRIAADVAPLTTPEECEIVIERENRALLDSLVQSINTKLGAGTLTLTMPQ